MRIKIVSSVSLLLFISFMGINVSAENGGGNRLVEASCSEWRPYAYKEDGVIKGSAYNIAKDVFDHARVNLNYRILPWARVYKNGLDKTNYLIGCLGRTPKREKLFHWVGPVTKGVKIYFYKMKSNSIKIGSLILTCGIVSSVHISNSFLPKNRILPALCTIHDIEGISVNVPVKLYMRDAMPLCNLIQQFYLSSSAVNE